MFTEILNLSLSKSTEKYLTSHVSKDFLWALVEVCGCSFPLFTEQRCPADYGWDVLQAGTGNVKHRHPSTSIQPHPIFIISTQGGEQRELPKTTWAWFMLDSLFAPSDGIISSSSIPALWTSIHLAEFRPGKAFVWREAFKDLKS